MKTVFTCYFRTPSCPNCRSGCHKYQLKTIFLDFAENELDIEFEVEALQSQIGTYQQVIARQNYEVNRLKVNDNLRKRLINSLADGIGKMNDKFQQQTALIEQQNEKLAELKTRLKKRSRPVEHDISPEQSPRRSKRARVAKEPFEERTPTKKK